MRFFINILFFLFTWLNLSSQQNLVPNGSFEDYYFCPNKQSQIDSSCKYWFTPWSLYDTINKIGSSDYFNSCANWPVSIPNNINGNCTPKSGNSYSGIALFSQVSSLKYIWKEYISIEVSKLSKNSEYCIICHYSIAENDLFNLNAYNFKLGFNLSNLPLSRVKSSSQQNYPPDPINLEPQVSVKLIKNIDTVNWILASGKFIANGDEKYLTIGNFQPLDTLKDAYIYIY